jgi:tetratricopeptide (TPR) repeat protein
VGEYLGAEISEVRWAIERNTEVSRRILEVELKSHWNDSRQFYEEGVICYERAEREMARELFEKAVQASRTNAFAWEYLGFLAAHRDDSEQTLRCFELAEKFATTEHLRGFANYHLARAFHAVGDERRSVESARAAVACDPKNNVYRYELVQALMRLGKIDEAIAILRRLIHYDWKYWSVSAFHRLLDPMRPQVNRLLETMREEQRKLSDRLMTELVEAVLKLDSVNDGNLTPLITVARIRVATFQETYAKGKVFDYLEIQDAARGYPEQLIQQAIDIYQECVARRREKLENLIQSSEKLKEQLSEQIFQLRQRDEAYRREVDASISQLKERHAEAKGDGWGSGIFTLVFLWLEYKLILMALAGPPGERQAYTFPLIVVGSLPFMCFYTCVRTVVSRIRKGSEFRSALAKHRDERERETKKIAGELEALERRAQETERTNSEEIQKLTQETEANCADWQQKITTLQMRPRPALP